MDALKSIADVVEHVLYEALGLLLPGAVLGFAAVGAWQPSAIPAVVAAAGQHPWLAALAAYLTGYVVQGVSRPTVTCFDWVLSLPGRAVLRVLPTKLREAVRRAEVKIGSRQSHATESQSATDAVDTYARKYWAQRLGVAPEALRVDQVRDLCFSAILPARKQLDRFRAATSFCRGCSVGAAVALTGVAFHATLGSGPATWIALALLSTAFYALVERSDMYDRLWKSILPVQFAAAQLTKGADVPAIPQITDSTPTSDLTTPRRSATHA